MTIRCLVAAVLTLSFVAPQAPGESDTANQRPRVIVSTDIGGTDPDDFQLMVIRSNYAPRGRAPAVVDRRSGSPGGGGCSFGGEEREPVAASVP
jgi:hypothetical protein